ncbi:unnamed protein product, partial [Rotaria magnacalcarata]
VVGLIMVVAGSAAYGNNNNNTDARNAIFAGAVFLGLGTLCFISAIIKICANCSDSVCGCHLACCD